MWLFRVVVMVCMVLAGVEDLIALDQKKRQESGSRETK